VTPRKHFSLFLSAVCVWAAFWLAGLPSYYQQYSVVTMAVATNLLSVATGAMRSLGPWGQVLHLT
jgi:ABC-type transporter Mla subunit MlaD